MNADRLNRVLRDAVPDDDAERMLRYLETGVYDDETQRAVVRMLLAFSLRLKEYIEESRPGERWC